MKMEVIPHWLTKQAYLAPEQVAIETEDGQMITFLKLQQMSESFAKKLAHLGITDKSHVGILSTNDPLMVVAIHALSYIGATCVLLNTRLTKNELNFQVTDAQISLILTNDDMYDHVRAMQFEVPTYSFSYVDTLKEKASVLKDELHLNDVFTIMYTSGTTGLPKGVVHTYGNHWWSAIGSALNLGLNRNDKWLAPLPLFHVSGLSICIRSVIYGIPIYLLKKFDAKIVHQAIMKKGVTIASVVTVMLQRLLDRLKGARYPSSFRCMLLGGGPCPQTTLEQAKLKHIPVFQSYGMTETASQIVTLSPKDALSKLGSAGKPLFPGQLMIKHPDDQGVGEIFVKGPMVTKGYYRRDEENNRLFQDGWLATGDLGYLDQEGFLYVIDRRDDLIISGGENIYPSEIESVLSEITEIKEVGVVGKKDETWGEVPVAFVVPKVKTLTKSYINTYGRKFLASYKIPKDIYFVDQLPRNATNKLKRHVLMDWVHKKN